MPRSIFSSTAPFPLSNILRNEDTGTGAALEANTLAFVPMEPSSDKNAPKS